MKTFLFLLGLVAAGIVGYSFEPDLRHSLTGKQPESRKPKPQIVPIAAADPEEAPAAEEPEEIDPASLSPDQLPKQVILKTNVDITDAELDLKVTITAGNPVDLIRIEGENAIISPGSEKYRATLPISQTDLIERLTSPPPAEPEIAVVPPAAPEAPAETAPELAAETAAAETPAGADPSPATADTPEPAADPEPATEPEPVAEVQPEPPAAPPAAPAAPVSKGSVVAVMQSSIKAGEIKEFNYDQVLDWEASPAPETIDGESYQTGIASYKAETVFGVKTIQAKALIKGGKVVKWLWPKSGMEIK